MFWDVELTPEEEDEIIEWAAKEIYKYGMETAAILFLESYKPISRLGTSMGQVFFTPLLPVFGDQAMVKGDRLFKVFQEERNVERLIQKLEHITAHGIKPTEKKEEKSEKKEQELEPQRELVKEKKGWRRYLPF